LESKLESTQRLTQNNALNERMLSSFMKNVSVWENKEDVVENEEGDDDWGEWNFALVTCGIVHD